MVGSGTNFKNSKESQKRRAKVDKAPVLRHQPRWVVGGEKEGRVTTQRKKEEAADRRASPLAKLSTSFLRKFKSSSGVIAGYERDRACRADGRREVEGEIEKEGFD